MKILFISPVPIEGAGCRFRIYQYFPHLGEHNIKVNLSPFLFSSYFKIVYKPGKFFFKTVYFFLSTLKRLYDLIRASSYDIIFIYRESYPIGPPVFEYILHFIGKSIICDFDDAIFLPNTSKVNWFLSLLRRRPNIDKIIRLSDCIIAGNDYLKEYALKFNKNVFMLPTVVDTNNYVPAIENKHNANEKVVIGWIGSPTTQSYIKTFIPIFRKLREKYKNILLKIVGGDFTYTEYLADNIIIQKWFLQKELKELQSFDIGIMPMPDSNWTKGKCGFKAILYMSVGIPVVCSKVGVNSEIVQDGVNGFLASNKEEWIKKLSILIENPGLRANFALRGRKTADEKYSVKVNAPKFLEILQSVCKKKF